MIATRFDETYCIGLSTSLNFNSSKLKLTQVTAFFCFPNSAIISNESTQSEQNTSTCYCEIYHFKLRNLKLES